MSSRQQRKRHARRAMAAVLGVMAAAGVALAGTALADSPAADQARKDPLTPYTPCSVTAKACVDLDSQRSWLIKDGKIFKGPVPIASGGNGTPTPIGHSLRVYRKDPQHKSEESRLPNGAPAPMPWSTFFADGGIAFHSGDPARSSGGCIHLADPDARAWFDYLQIGDQVQVVSNGQEMAARGMH